MDQSAGAGVALPPYVWPAVLVGYVSYIMETPEAAAKSKTRKSGRSELSLLMRNLSSSFLHDFSLVKMASGWYESFLWQETQRTRDEWYHNFGALLSFPFHVSGLTIELFLDSLQKTPISLLKIMKRG